MADQYDVETLSHALNRGSVAPNGQSNPPTEPLPRPSTVGKNKSIRPSDRDPAEGIPGMPPNFGDWSVPHVLTFQGLLSSIAKVYRPSDEALRHSFDNARFMRNDPVIMECIEQRQRSLALLDWHLEPDDADDPEQVALCDDLKAIIEQTPRFMQYRENLSHAVWFGRYAIAHKFAWKRVRGKMRVCVNRWKPVHGDKLVFRFDDGSHDFDEEQIGIRVSTHFALNSRIGQRWKVENAGSEARDGGVGQTDRGLAYFLAPYERSLLAVHKHYIEDGEFDDPQNAGRVHGVGIRSRIYWVWYQKQELLAWLMEFLERSSFGMELWYYPWGNNEAREKMREAAQERIGQGRNVILVPKPLGDEGMAYGVEHMETGMAGAQAVQDIIEKYFGHLIKRYILGQTLTSEAGSTGLGSNLASVHLDTYMQIVRYDATNLEETLTTDLVAPLLKFNFPSFSDCPVRFRIDTSAPDVEEKLAAWEKAWSMGVKLRSQDVMDLIGASAPDKGDDVLDKLGAEQQAQQAAQMPPPGAAPPPGMPPGMPPGGPGGPPAGPGGAGPPPAPLPAGSPEAQVYGAVQADQDAKRLEMATGVRRATDRQKMENAPPEAATTGLPGDAQQIATALPHPSGFDPEALGKGLAAELQRVPDAALALKVAQKNLELNPEHYAKHKPGAGQGSLWDESDHPREKKGTAEGGQFAAAEGGADTPTAEPGETTEGGLIPTPAEHMVNVVRAVKDAMGRGESFAVNTHTKSYRLSHQESIRATSQDVQFRRGKEWLSLTREQIDHWAEGVGQPALGGRDGLTQKWAEAAGPRPDDTGGEEGFWENEDDGEGEHAPEPDAPTADESAKYADYAKLMKEHGMPVETEEAWTKRFREHQAMVRERQAENAEKPQATEKKEEPAELPADEPPTPEAAKPEKSRGNPERAERLRILADAMQDAIDKKRGPRLENTPKRQREGMIARIDGDELERVQSALRVLATAHEDGSIPEDLAGFKTKAALTPMLRTGTLSHGYYHVGDTGEYHDKSPLAVKFRDFIEERSDNPATRAKRESKKKADSLRELEGKVRNVKIPGFFPTPADLAEKMVRRANIQQGHKVLEPSAGKGDLLDAVRKYTDGEAKGIEQYHDLAEISRAKGHDVESGDFLEHAGEYDRIVMNPPFEKGQDQEHVRHAFDLLKPGGRLVSVMSAHAFFASDKKSVAFREWLDEMPGHWVDELPAGSFSGSDAFRQTGVNARLVIIDKPKGKAEPYRRAVPAGGTLASMFAAEFASRSGG